MCSVCHFPGLCSITRLHVKFLPHPDWIVEECLLVAVFPGPLWLERVFTTDIQFRYVFTLNVCIEPFPQS